MADRHWYDKDGNYRGTSSNTSPFMNFIYGAVVLFVAGWMLLPAIWKLLNGYESYPFPFNVIVGYYFVLIAIPLKGAGWIFSALTAPGVTQYKNLNTVIGAFVAFATVVLPYAGAFLLIRRKQLQHFIPVMLAGPLAISIVLIVVFAVISWLFS